MMWTLKLGGKDEIMIVVSTTLSLLQMSMSCLPLYYQSRIAKALIYRLEDFLTDFSQLLLLGVISSGMYTITLK